MQIWSAADIRAWDQYTIANEPIPSIHLMERASKACYAWIAQSVFSNKAFTLFCGKGNNGGDGLALARLLHETGHAVQVIVLEYGHKGTPDFQQNLSRLHALHVPVSYISSAEHIHPIPEGRVIIDAIFGTGLDRPPDPLASQLIRHLNTSGRPILSIDMPSGLYADKSSKGQSVVEATHTLTFQCYKWAFLMAENDSFIGQVHVLDIGLHPDFPRIHAPRFQFITREWLLRFYRTRSDFSHKGVQGHAALLIGQQNMMGAAILSAKACLRAGTGKLTCFIPEQTVPVMQIALPEAICQSIDPADHSFHVPVSSFDAWGAGPGIGISEQTYHLLAELLAHPTGKRVLDADALNLLSLHPELLQTLPPQTILTPHVGEFERLAGKAENDFHRLEMAMAFARNHQCIVVLKGRYTFVTDPEKGHFFNTSGNSGLAKAGTGDVLTGIITSYLAQGYAPMEAALLGVYMHGLAADHAIQKVAKTALLASDVVESLTTIQDLEGA